MSKPILGLLAALSFLFTSAGTASAQDVELAWIPPAGSLVAGYNVYIASSGSGPIVATPIDVGRPPVDELGIARARIRGIAPSGLRIEMTSYDASRRESARSNRVFLMRRSEYVDEPIWAADFTGLAPGAHPAGFVDSGASFAVAEHPTGNRVLALGGAEGFPVSRYTGSESVRWEPYELSGRIFFQPGSRTGGVAVRVPLAGRSGADPLGSGFSLAGDSTGVFVVRAHGGDELECANSTSTGVSALATRWFRFRLRYTEPNQRSRVRARVWRDGSAEPAEWQVDCWTDALPAADSGVFALHRDGSGAVFWDDLQVRPVRGWWEQIPYL
jgi:hypothetical protein